LLEDQSPPFFGETSRDGSSFHPIGDYHVQSPSIGSVWFGRAN
jgi:hypothetical protein